MAFVKRKDRFGRVIIEGVGMVVNDQSGVLIKESEKNRWGSRSLSVAILGTWLRTKGGRTLRELYRFYEWDNNPLADILRQLQYGDMVYVFGVLETHSFLPDDGGARVYYQRVKLEFILRFANAKSSHPYILGLTSNSLVRSSKRSDRLGKHFDADDFGGYDAGEVSFDDILDINDYKY